MPEDAAWLVCLIYGGYNGVAPVQCRYDLTGGLSPVFENWLGWLMGCVLSPDKAKVFLDTCLFFWE